MKRHSARGKQYKPTHAPIPEPVAATLPSEAVTLDIETLSHDGRGVARFNGKATFVSDALPGETVLARLTESKSKYNLAQIEQILTASPDRVTPFCPHYEQCGGCDLQHLSASRQVELKQTQVLEQLQRIGQCSPEETLPPLRAATDHYRRSARIGINQLSDGEPIVGFRRHNSNLLCQIDSCPVLEPRLDNLFAAIRAQLSPLGDIKHITQLDVDLGDQQGFLTIRHKKPLNAEAIQAFQQLAADYQLALAFQGTKTSDPGVEQPETASGMTAAYQLNGLTLNFRPGDFIQVNAQINQQMIDQAIRLLEPAPGDQILDLFCGLGNFTLPLAQQGAAVTGIEGSVAMVSQAQLNAQQNNLTDCEFHCANLTEDLSRLTWYRKPYNKIVLDPPRAGAQEIIGQLCALKADKILYISCNPGALARDTQALKQEGYRLQKFLVMDMFPQTHHIESMALFVRGKKPAAKKKVISGKKLWSKR